MALIGGKRDLLEEDIRKVSASRRRQAARQSDVDRRPPTHYPTHRPGLTPAPAESYAARERSEMREILERGGYEHTAADVAGLQRDGMGPFELEERVRQRDDNIGYWAANTHFKTLRRGR